MQIRDELFGNKVKLRMVLMPGGSFIMGASESELDSYDEESPQHEVHLEPFCLGKYPITQAQWRFVAGLAPVEIALEPAPSNFKGDYHPVEQVSWYEAVEFCQRLCVYTGKAYQIPSEAQWEYACRATTTTPFHFGNTITTELVNYWGTHDKKTAPSMSSRYGSVGEYRETTTPVDYFKVANAFGLCEMHGNVWEWCADQWHHNYEGAPIDGSVWLSEEKGAACVIRGGGWSDTPDYCRSASRFYLTPDDRSNVIGFRVCCLA